MTIQQWQLQGLPSDAVSVENAVILANSARWPLCIDPQGQATAWIKRQHQAEELVVCPLTVTLKGSVPTGVVSRLPVFDFSFFLVNFFQLVCRAALIYALFLDSGISPCMEGMHSGCLSAQIHLLHYHAGVQGN